MHYLITGNQGFIGSILSNALIGAEHTISGIDIRDEGVGNRPGSRFVQGDIRDRAVLREAMSGADCVIHLAAEHADSNIPSQRYFAINENGTKSLLDAATEHGISKFVLFSSVAVYGLPGRATEETPPSPTHPYGASKLGAEAAVERWVSDDPARAAIILRPTAVFGPENYANLYRLISMVCEGTFRWIGKGNNIKSVAYVENLVAATLYLLGRMESGIQVYNYSDDPQLRMKQLVDLIAAKAGVQVDRRRIPYPLALLGGRMLALWSWATGRASEITVPRIKKFCMHTDYPTDKLRALGCRQKYTLEQGIEKTVQWYLNHEMQVSGTRSSVAETKEGLI
ncbi:MAG: NAD(P)-dependent oxidoreductase [Fidelibacterota bacterium]|nr:MAG: NAD(P)-dependent oxidoreductase [Candidatus Neomarinimicrobiota bacterium]